MFSPDKEKMGFSVGPFGSEPRKNKIWRLEYPNTGSEPGET
jgi:hypothetical protein